MNEELLQRANLGIDPDLPLLKGRNEELAPEKKEPLRWITEQIWMQIRDNPKLYPPPPGFSNEIF